MRHKPCFWGSRMKKKKIFPKVWLHTARPEPNLQLIQPSFMAQAKDTFSAFTVEWPSAFGCSFKSENYSYC